MSIFTGLFTILPSFLCNYGVHTDPQHKKGIPLPKNYQKLTQKRLLEILGDSDHCRNLDTQHNERFVSVYHLKAKNKLLALACDMGAYQDSHLLYFLKTNNTNVTAYSLNLLEPVFKKGWSLRLSKKLTGSINVDSETNQLDALRLYTAFGACGYEISYNLSSLHTAKTIKPMQLTADNNCDNGVLVDQWPMIDIDKLR